MTIRVKACLVMVGIKYDMGYFNTVYSIMSLKNRLSLKECFKCPFHVKKAQCPLHENETNNDIPVQCFSNSYISHFITNCEKVP